jgi:molybdate/tungstate transport system permease protein
LKTVGISSGKAFQFIKRHRLILLFSLPAVIILLFIFVPLLKMVFLSDKNALWQSVLDPVTLKSIGLTLGCGLMASAVGFLLGVPLAYLLARTQFKLKSLVEGLIDLPIIVPHSAAGIALLFVFGKNYLVGKAFNSIGIQFVDSIPGIVIAMLFVSVPFLINSARDGFKKVDVRLENAARTLGASPFQVFLRVTFPLAWKNIVSGNLMMWARGISEFGAVIILAYHPMIAPILVYERLNTFGLSQAIPVAALLVIVCALIFVGVRYFLHRESGRD